MYTVVMCVCVCVCVCFATTGAASIALARRAAKRLATMILTVGSTLRSPTSMKLSVPPPPPPPPPSLFSLALSIAPFSLVKSPCCVAFFSSHLSLKYFLSFSVCRWRGCTHSFANCSLRRLQARYCLVQDPRYIRGGCITGRTWRSFGSVRDNTVHAVRQRSNECASSEDSWFASAVLSCNPQRGLTPQFAPNTHVCWDRCRPQISETVNLVKL